MSFPCRIWPHEAADGPANMALDEVLLESVGDDPRLGMFRTYTWTVPTLSLGYFQAIGEAESDPRWRDVPIVRRATGGGAIWHHRELTYALALPVVHPLARRGGNLYRAVHRAIAELLADQGLAVERRGEATARAGCQRPLLCFADRDAEDLVAGDVKVVGSAQRRRAGAVLQHGSILLARSPRTPELLGVGDLAPISTDPATWSALVVARIPRALGLVPEPAGPGAAERGRAHALEREVYREAAWTRRR